MEKRAPGLSRGVGIDNPGGYLSALVGSTVEQALRAASDPLAPPAEY